jgi:leader peptidase (prepilin peptidase)/N-methyltransferase
VALAALGFGLAFALVLLVLRFGMGDVKLALTVGLIAAWLGPDAIITTVYVGAGSGAAVALALLVIHRRRRLTFSFGPFLAIGSVAGMVTAGL